MARAAWARAPCCGRAWSTTFATCPSPTASSSSTPGRTIPLHAPPRRDRRRPAASSRSARSPARGSLPGRPPRIGGEVFVVLDQVEEYFLYHPSRTRESGRSSKSSPRRCRGQRCRASFLISLREDAVAKLDRFKARIPNLLRDFLRLEHLDRPSARQAIVGPVERYNALSADGSGPRRAGARRSSPRRSRRRAGRAGAGRRRDGRRAVAQGDRVEAPYLQLVMERIWQAELSAGSLGHASSRRFGTWEGPSRSCEITSTMPLKRSHRTRRT